MVEKRDEGDYLLVVQDEGSLLQAVNLLPQRLLRTRFTPTHA